jgi:hypothetical protein
VIFIAAENCNISCGCTQAFVIYTKIYLALYDKYNLVAVVKMRPDIQRGG